MNGRRDGRVRGGMRRGNLRNVFLVSYFLLPIVPGGKGKNTPLLTTHVRKHEPVCPVADAQLPAEVVAAEQRVPLRRHRHRGTMTDGLFAGS